MNKYFISAFYFVLLIMLGFTFSNCERVIYDQDDLVVTDRSDGARFLGQNPDAQTFLKALDLTGQKSKLNEGGFSIYVPSEEAFDLLYSESDGIWTSIEDISINTLTNIVQYHFSSKNIRLQDTSAQYITTTNVTKFDEEAVLFVKSEGNILLNGERNVVIPDIQVTNGIIHFLDEVLIPPTVLTLVESNPDLSMMTEALSREDLSTNFMETLNGDGPFTVFAPTDTAFAQLLATENTWKFVDDIPAATLEKFLKYHISTVNNLRNDALTNDLDIPTLLGTDNIKVVGSGNNKGLQAASNNAFILETDAQGTNGVVHLIDQVLMPNL